MNGIARKCTVFFLFGIMSVPLLNAFDIVRDGTPRSRIVLSAESSLPEKLAAGELRDYAEKITGGAVPVQNAPSSDSGNIILLSGKAAESILRDWKMSPDGFCIRSGKNLYIASPTSLGVLYGVYTLLEKYAGVRWLFPGRDGEYFTPSKTLTVPDGDFVSNPSFPDRTMQPTGGNAFAGMYGAAETWKWLARNKIHFAMIVRGEKNPKLKEGDDFLAARGGFLKPGGHETFTLSVPNSLFETHPEYFCMVNGERLPQFHPSVKIGGCTYAQVCTSHPAVINRISDFILSRFKQGEKLHYPVQFLYGAGDNCNTWCYCDSCKKQFGNSTPDRFYYMVNKTAEKVFREKPDAELHSWIYADFRTPPEKIKPDSRIKFTFCDHGRCYTHAFNDPNCLINVHMKKLSETWEKLVGPLKIYEYYCVGAPYAPLEVTLAKDLKYYHIHGMRGYNDEIPAPDAYYAGHLANGKNGTPTRRLWQARWQQIYLASKMLWDVNLDVEKTLDEANALYFGPAFPAMKPYRKLLGQLWEGLSEHMVYGTGGVAFPGAYAMLRPDADKLVKYLDEAEKLAGNTEPYKTRIAQERTFLTNTWLNPLKELREKQKSSGTIQPAAGKIIIDGVLDEADWRNAGILGRFTTAGGKEPSVQTFVKSVFDSERLYVGFVCMEPSIDKARLLVTGKDGNVWEDNGVEWMINPSGSPSNYFYFAVNSNGVLLDMELKDGVWHKEFDSGASIAVKVLKDRWIVEGAVPLKSLGASLVPGTLWKFNFCRGRRLSGGIQELSSICEGGFQGSFRTFSLGQSPLKNGSMNEVVEAKNQGAWKVPSGKLPKHWILGQSHSKTNTVGEAFLRDPILGEYELHIREGQVFQYLFEPASTPRTIRISFSAHGEKKLFVSIYRFVYEPDGDRKSKRVNRPTEGAFSVDLSPEKKNYSGTYTVKPGEQVYLAFYAPGEAFIDDVSVVPAGSN